ncbi:hypothetical protein AYO38_06455 [bacterium SCGC AG-212-C10]|nr:hypothetical protein AYO38_06455 [bacterium SCGC AG-212-C10]
MAHDFTAVMEKGDKSWIAYSPEIPGAYGQGATIEDAKADLAGAIKLMLEVQREEYLRDVPPGAVRDVIHLP